MDLNINFKDIDLRRIFFVDVDVDEEILEEFLNEVETYVSNTLLYGTVYDGLFYKMFTSTCIKYLLYSNTDRPFTLHSLYEISKLANKTTIFEWSEFDYMIYQIDCDDIKHRANILHEHSIFNIFFERCYREEEFTFCLLETLLHTIGKFICKYEIGPDFEMKQELFKQMNKLYNTALSEDKYAFYIQCRQFLNRDKIRKI